MNNIFGYVAFITGFICLIPQIIKSYKTRSTGDLSLAMWVLLAVTNAAWFIHGLLQSDIPLILANAVSFTFAVTMIVLKKKFS